jgi:hypothetical protein
MQVNEILDEVKGKYTLLTESNSETKKSKPAGMVNEKICPFQSTADKQCVCTPQCKLYRYAPKNAGFECPFQELMPISYALRGKAQR